MNGIANVEISEAPALKLRQQVEDFEIEPDERHDQAEGSIPLHVFGRSPLDSVLDKVEVEDEVQRGDHNDKEAEPDADQSAPVDVGDAHAEKNPR